MNEAFERYNKRVEIPISIILETIFSDDNKDVESLSRWALKYGFVDLIKKDEDKLGYYKLQDDYTKQSFYILLDKEERKQYEYEDYLLDKIDQSTNNWNELEELISNLLKEADSTKSDLYIYEQNKAIMRMILDNMKKIKEKNNA